MESDFHLVRAGEVVIAGLQGAGMTVRAGSRTLGRLRGIIVDGADRRIRYLVVRAAGLFSKSTLVPFAEARVDLRGRIIELAIDERDLWQLRNFTPEHLLAGHSP